MIETVPHTVNTLSTGFTYCPDKVQSIAEGADRQEVTIAGAIEAQNHTMVYAFLPGCAEYDLDPWRYLDGVDLHTKEDRIDIWFESGACKTANVTDCEIRFFVSKAEIAN